MNYIILGVIGFLVIHLFDIFAFKKWPLVKPLSWFLGSGLLVYATVMACLGTDKLLLPAWVIWLGWPVLIASAIILVYSLFINLPFRRTYIEKGSGSQLITTGLYSLVRHPWFYGFCLAILSLILITGSILLTYALAIWIPVVILLISIQDKFLFGQMFSGYDNYRKKLEKDLKNYSLNELKEKIYQKKNTKSFKECLRPCKENEICNTKTGRCVMKDSTTGKGILRKIEDLKKIPSEFNEEEWDVIKMPGDNHCGYHAFLYGVRTMLEKHPKFDY